MKILMAYQHYPVSIARFWKLALQNIGHDVDSIGNCTQEKQAWWNSKGQQISLPEYIDRPTFPVENFANRYISC